MQSAVSGQRKSNYRPEIDGLRGFAVIAVIINHFSKDILPSGYLGVDIFFVISGYVITSSLAKREYHSLGHFITNFYTRRVKRLLPTITFFVFSLSICICLFNPDPIISLRTGFASLIGLSNFYLLKQSTNYFSTSTVLNPFTHTWSLGVEEQFYFLYPFLIWFSGFGQKRNNASRNFLITLLFFTSLSLCLFIYLYQTNQPAAYFLMPSRLWEISAGCLAYLIVNKYLKIKQGLDGIKPFFIGIGIISVMTLPNSWAVQSTISIVILTMLLIVCIQEESGVYKLLVQKGIRHIGLISYSLYLWHWGILSISNWTIGIQSWTLPLQLGVIYLCSSLSYYWIEEPFRNTKNINKPIVLFLSTFLILFSTSYPTTYGKIYMDKLYLGKKINYSKYKKETCSKELSSTWIVGDSHTGYFSNITYYATDGDCKVVRKKEKNSVSYSFLFNSKIIGTNKGLAIRKVNLENPSNFIEQANKEPLKRVILSTYWAGFFADPKSILPSYDWKVSDYYDIDGSKVDYNRALKSYINNIKETAMALKNVDFIIVLPTPEFDWVNAGGKPLGSCSEKQWFDISNSKYPAAYYDTCMNYEIPGVMDLNTTQARVSHITKSLKELAVSSDNIRLFDLIPILCKDGVCSTHDSNGVRLYQDDDHLNENTVDIIGPILRDFIYSSKKVN